MERPSRGWYLVLLIGVGVLSLSGLSAWRALQLPSDGTDWAPDAWGPDGLRLSPSGAHAGGLQAGDRVVAVAGHSLETWAQALLQPRFPRPRWQVGQTVTYGVLRGGARLDVPLVLTRFPLDERLRQRWGLLLTSLTMLVVGTFVFVRRPDHEAARVFFLSACCGSATTGSSLLALRVVDIVDGVRFWLFRVTGQGMGLAFFIAILHFALIFPQPLPQIRQYRRVIALIYALPLLFYVGYIGAMYFLSSNTLVWLGTWTTGARPLFIALLLLAAGALLTQYRTRARIASRREIRWVLWAVLFSAGSYLLLYLLPVIASGQPLIGTGVQGFLALPIPLALLIAILRYQAFDIDVLINRVLVYGALTACVVVIYALVVGYLGSLLQMREQHAASLIAAGIIAVLFQPLRVGLQRTVNRWMFGERDDPYRVLAGLGQRLEAAFEPAAILPTLVQTVRESLRLPYVAITLEQNGATEFSANLSGRDRGPTFGQPAAW